MKKFLIVLFVFAGAVSVSAQEPAFASASGIAGRDGGSINAARELYASARYDEALAMLNGLRPTEMAQPGDRKTVEQYRSLCLLALGRGEEAEGAIAAVVNADPFFVPTESDASPRVRTAFTDVRKRLLPEIAAGRYSSAKQAYDRKDYPVAERQFREVVSLLDDPQMNGRGGDLRVLATGFLDLAAAAAAPPPPPKPEPAPVAPAPVAAKPEPPRVYTGDEPGVGLPVTVRQQFPNVPSSITGLTRDRGVLEVVIDEQGRVIGLALRAPIHPVYDALLLGAAKDWRYKPATFNGTPVRFRKLIQVTLPRR